MRFLHVADTHVGHTAYHRLTPEGLNQREADFFGAFRQTVDVALRQRVDFVLHAGDLFDSVRPSNRAITHVLSEVKRLGEAGIPFVVISGNHEAPRLRETGAVLRFLDFLPLTHAVYKAKYEKIVLGDVAIHAVPHCASNEALAQQISHVRKDEAARFNVATLHAGVVGVGDFRTGEFNEQTVAQNELPPGMDYTALGHYHRCTEIVERVWYAGSSERCTFREAGETKSVNLVDLARDKVLTIPLECRPMVTLPTLHLDGVLEAEMPGRILEAIESAPLKDAIARLRVTGLPRHVYAALDFAKLKALTAGALHFDLQPELVQRDGGASSGGPLGNLADEFEGYLATKPVEGADREQVLAEARTLLLAAESGEGA